jgi:hypothetical protein
MRMRAFLISVAGVLLAGAGAAQQVPPQMPPDTRAPAHRAQPPSATPQGDAAPQQPQTQPRPAMPVAAPSPNTGTSAAAPGRGGRAPSASSATPPAQSGARKVARRGKKKPSPIPEPPQQAIVTPPPVPQTLQQMPPTAPRVSYQNGTMSVDAANSRLGDVLQAIRQATGAAMDVPPQAGEQRIVFRYGPATPRDVVTALLNGSGYNYVIVGSSTNPGAVERVIVNQANGATGGVPGGMPVANAPAPVTPVIGSPAEDNDNEADQPPRGVNPAQLPPTRAPQQPPAPTPFPGVQPAPATPNPTPGAVPDRNPPEGQQVKSPEQLLEELKRMQQQQQQQQQKPPK